MCNGSGGVDGDGLAVAMFGVAIGGVNCGAGTPADVVAAGGMCVAGGRGSPDGGFEGDSLGAVRGVSMAVRSDSVLSVDAMVGCGAGDGRGRGCSTDWDGAGLSFGTALASVLWARAGGVATLRDVWGCAAGEGGGAATVTVVPASGRECLNACRSEPLLLSTARVRGVRPFTSLSSGSAPWRRSTPMTLACWANRSARDSPESSQNRRTA